jgi:hypothetical protein
LATKEGGLLDNLRAAIERRFAAANLKLRRHQLTIVQAGLSGVLRMRSRLLMLRWPTAQGTRHADG